MERNVWVSAERVPRRGELKESVESRLHSGLAILGLVHFFKCFDTSIPTHDLVHVVMRKVVQLVETFLPQIVPESKKFSAFICTINGYLSDSVINQFYLLP